jgi:hypothetical protein
MTAILFAVFGFSVLANIADEYLTAVGLKSGRFKEANPFARLITNPTASALVKCVALPLVGLSVGWLYYPLFGIVYNGIFGAGITIVAFRNYRLIRGVRP